MALSNSEKSFSICQLSWTKWNLSMTSGRREALHFIGTRMEASIKVDLFLRALNLKGCWTVSALLLRLIAAVLLLIYRCHERAKFIWTLFEPRRGKYHRIFEFIPLFTNVCLHGFYPGFHRPMTYKSCKSVALCLWVCVGFSPLRCTVPLTQCRPGQAPPPSSMRPR